MHFHAHKNISDVKTNSTNFCRTGHDELHEFPQIGQVRIRSVLLLRAGHPHLLNGQFKQDEMTDDVFLLTSGGGN